MKRPLQQKTALELFEFVERNHDNKAELELALDELRRRKTISAKRVAQTAERHLTKLKEVASKYEQEHRDGNLIPPGTPNGEKEPSMAAASDNEGNTESEERRWTHEAISDLRKKLIDLSKRNSLLNFKHSTRGVSHLRIVDERTDLVYKHLMASSFGFEPLPDEEIPPRDEQTSDFRISYERARLTDEDFLAVTGKLGDEEGDARAWQDAERQLRASLRKQTGLPAITYGKSLDVKALAIAHGFDPSFDLKDSDEGDPAEHHLDDKLRVLLTKKELEKRLKTIWDRYQSHKRETGLHTLFLVLGFIQWFEDDASDIALYAPLLMLPVQLERKVRTGRYEFRLCGADEGLEVNIALAEKLRRMGVEMPPLRSEETPESYFVRIEGLFEKGRRLSLRRFATLAVLPFPRMVLWKDLDPANWSDGAFVDHPILPILLRAKGTGGAPSMGDTFDIDDPKIASMAPPLIQEADASQHSALIDVIEGRSIAIEGPPGTGKSQTITNMIAAAVKTGKRVLFVAEKQAALTVVADRLRHAGLGTLLLELHSDSANRTHFYESLRTRRAANKKTDEDEAPLEHARGELAKARSLLRKYLLLIRTSLGARKRSAYWLAWRQISLQNSVRRDSVEAASRKWHPHEPSKISESGIDEARSRLATFSTALAAIEAGKTDGRRTDWCEAEKLGPFDQQTELAAARGAGKAAAGMAEASTKVTSALSVDLPGVGGELGKAVEQLDALPDLGGVPENVAASVLRDAEGARALLGRQSRWRQICGRLSLDIQDPVSVSVAAREDLSNALGALTDVPFAAKKIEERLLLIRKAQKEAHELNEDASELSKVLSNPETLTLTDFEQIAKSIVRLDSAAPKVKIYFRAELLEELTLLSIEQQLMSAATINSTREQLAEQVTGECFEIEPAELDRLASLLDSTGFLSRIVSGDYRNGKKQVRRLMLTPMSDRPATASLLRSVSRNVRQCQEFRRDSPVAAMVPSSQWHGVHTDWASLGEAATALRNASNSLNGKVRERALLRWLEAPMRERSNFAAAARTLVCHLEDLCALGYGNISLSELEPTLTAAEQAYRATSEALATIGLTDDAMIARDGERLTERLEIMHAAEVDFDKIKSASCFEWVGSIRDSLDELGRALTNRDKLVSIGGPLGVTEALIRSQTPVAQLDDLIAAREGYQAAVTEWKSAEQNLVLATGLDIHQLRLSSLRWNEVSDRLAALSLDEAGARLAADLLRYRSSLHEIHCEALADAALAGEVASEELADLYELMVVRDLLHEFLGGDGAGLAKLGGLSLQNARDAFVRIDKQLQELEAKAIVAVRVRDKAPYGVDRGPRSAWTELALLQHELGLKRPRTPIRDITSRAGKALQTIKPIWMMSPTSAAQFIQPGSLEFDLLIIDEASQMRPEFAVSAIMRARQFIVVGDANQLPPTDFFTASADDDDDDLALASGETEKLKVDTESILDLANERFPIRRRLKWHYRSQHESLIQFSNRQFYEGDLIVFPSPTMNDELLGVKHKYVGGTYEASINEAEAKAVIEEMFQLMRSYPERSIGIATMNAKQTELIQLEFDRLVLEAPEVRRYVDNYAGTIDEFFIKNLENIQGDERDIILISTVYGPDKNGTVMQRFGPMNREVGWRRLNVLVTRAKLSTRVFTSLRPDDIKITPTSNRGILAFKNYLTYAANGAQCDDSAGGSPDSDFEVYVADAIKAAGYEVVPQVGVEGFRIDIGVRHPDFPLGFIAGVECDGATYHSGMTVRDRDRIRQSVLERMGWNIYRIWSTDWFADPSRELAKLLSALDGWLIKLAEDYANRPVENLDETTVALTDLVVEQPEKLLGADSVTKSGPQPDVHEAKVKDQRTSEPTGRPMRSVDGIDWFEVSKARLYHVWVDHELAGSVEVLSRAMATAQVYGGPLRVAHSEYEGRVLSNGDRFIVHDIYAAVREVAQRARAVMRAA